MQNLSDEEGKLYLKSIEQLRDESFLEKDTALNTLGRLAEKADNYNIVENEDDIENNFQTDGEMYSNVWFQADELRKNGRLFNSLKTLKCPVIVIQGEYDPHPIEGVVEPLKEQGVSCEIHSLSKCGHSPFKEKYAK